MRYHPGMRLRFPLTLILVVMACSDSEVAPETDNPGNGNHRPVMVELPDTSVNVGSVLRLKFTASDPDGDNLTFHGSVGSSLSDVHLGTLPVFSFVSSETTLVFTPQDYDRPRRTAILWAEDGHGGIDTMTVRMTVN